METSLLVHLLAKITCSGKLRTRSIIYWHAFGDIARRKSNCNECKPRTIVFTTSCKVPHLLSMNSNVPGKQRCAWLRHSSNPGVGACHHCHCRAGQSSIQSLCN